MKTTIDTIGKSITVWIEFRTFYLLALEIAGTAAVIMLINFLKGRRHGVSSKERDTGYRG